MMQNSPSTPFDGVLRHVRPHKPTTFTFMCVTGTYVDVNPLWRDACFNIYLCVCVCSPVSLVCNHLCSLCACVCECGPMRGLVGRRRHNEMGGWAGASPISALNGQPEVPVSVWMRKVLLGGEGQRVSDGTVWLRSDPATNVAVCGAEMEPSKG